MGVRLSDERGTAGPAHRRNTGFSFNKRHPETFTCCGDGSADACGACANDGYVKISVHDLTSFVRSMYCQKLTTEHTEKILFTAVSYLLRQSDSTASASEAS
jgi:hypothetical protein